MKKWEMETVEQHEEILELVATRVANTVQIQQVLGQYFWVGVGPDNESLIIPIPDNSPAENACNLLFDLLDPSRLPQEEVDGAEDGDG